MGINKYFELLKNEFIYGGHLLSLGAASIVFTAAMMLDVDITWDFLLISYLIVYIAYSFNRLLEFKSDFLTNPLRTEHIGGYITVLPYIIMFSFLAILSLMAKFGNFNSLIFVLFMVAGSLLYTTFFKDLTKNIVGFKSFYVSFFWALLVLLFALYYNIVIMFPVCLVFSFVFLRLIVNTVFFDIKDIDSDKLHNLRTLPVYLGKKKVLLLIHVLNGVSFLPVIIGAARGFLPFSSLSLLLFYFYTVYYVESVENDSINLQKLSYAMVDGEYVLWSLVLFYFKF